MRTNVCRVNCHEADGRPSTWRSRAFGLDIESDSALPGLPAVAEPPGERRTTLELVTAEAIERNWPREGAERVLSQHPSAEGFQRTIDRHPQAGYRLYAHHFGSATITPDGSRVRCAPWPEASWRWQRFLMGRVLPWAALLQGLEIFHASAVAVAGGAVAFVGPTGAGKTSVAVQMVLRGADFITDDVLALERRDGDVLGHPGAAVASIRPAEGDAITPAGWQALGDVLATTDKTHVAVRRPAPPLPMRALYFLTRRAAGDDRVEALVPDLRLLLASAFVSSLQSPRRLRNHLDVCADLARFVPMFRLPAVSPGRGAQLADSVHRHLCARLGG